MGSLKKVINVIGGHQTTPELKSTPKFRFSNTLNVRERIVFGTFFNKVLVFELY